MFGYYFAKALKRLKPRAIKGSTIHKNSHIGPGSEFIDSTIQKHSYCGYDCRIVATQIGSFCSIANDCKIGLDSHPTEWASTSPVFSDSKGQRDKVKYATHIYQTTYEFIFFTTRAKKKSAIMFFFQNLKK